MDAGKAASSRGALFIPTGHADLDQLRKDGLSAWCRWHKSVAAGAAAGLTFALTIPVVYFLVAVFAMLVLGLQGDWAQAAAGLVQRAAAAAGYAREAGAGAAVLVIVGVAYALAHRWTVAKNRYFRVGPWEIGVDSAGAALAGYALFAAAAYVWEPLRIVQAWLFWASGPVFGWLLARLHEMYVLLFVRPDWSLAVESTVRVLLPRRFGCAADAVRVELDQATHAVTVYASVDESEAQRARELIQAIPETRSVTVAAPREKSAVSSAFGDETEGAAADASLDMSAAAADTPAKATMNGGVSSRATQW